VLLPLTCPVHSSLSLLLYSVFSTNKDDDDDDDESWDKSLEMSTLFIQIKNK